MQNQPEVSHVTIKPVPGMFTELTARGSLDRWVSGQLVRFHDGQPQKIGGWQNTLFTGGPVIGIPRSSHIWNDLNGQEWIAFGTGAKLYLISLNVLYDITPLRRQVGLAGPFAANGTNLLTVTDPSHGAQNGDWVRFTTTGVDSNPILGLVYSANNSVVANTPLTLRASPTVFSNTIASDFTLVSTSNLSGVNFTIVGTDWRGNPQAVTIAGPNNGSVITNSEWGSIISITPNASNSGQVSVGATTNGQFMVQNSNAQTYQIELPTGVAEGTANLGGTATAQYDITAGLDNQGFYFGWGAGTWGLGTWGTARTAANGSFSDMVQPLRLWSLDNWGQGLIAGIRNGSTYYWDRNTGPNARAVDISVNPEFPNNPGAPVNSLWTLVSNTNQQLVTLGSSHDGINDALYIAISDIDDFTDFTPSDTNSAYTGRLSAGSKIVSAVKTRTGILVETDTAAFLLQPNASTVFASQQIADETTILSPNAAIDVNGTCYIMGLRKWYEYDGVYRELPSDVWSQVWGKTPAYPGINTAMFDKVWTWHNDQWPEVWWFYVSAGGTEIDSYVILNYKDKHWSFGQLSRTGGTKSSTFTGFPMAFDTTGNMYSHENGVDGQTFQGSTIPITSFVTSYDIQTVQRSPYGAVTPGRGLAYNEGAEQIHISAVIPDIIYQTGQMTLTIKTKRYPQGAYVIKGPYSINPAPQASDQNQFLSVRARGKLANFTFGSSALGADWRIGNFTFLTQDDGER
jgi:hypothetical protein